MEQADKLERQAALRLQEIQNDLQVYTAQHSSVLANLRETSAQLKRLAEAQVWPSCIIHICNFIGSVLEDF